TFTDALCLGLNTNTGDRGIFPLSCVTEITRSKSHPDITASTPVDKRNPFADPGSLSPSYVMLPPPQALSTLLRVLTPHRRVMLLRPYGMGPLREAVRRVASGLEQSGATRGGATQAEVDVVRACLGEALEEGWERWQGKQGDLTGAGKDLVKRGVTVKRRGR
ncbi:hypothetical protein HK101_007016, partial [Irineochytrium annulatum]